MSDWKKRVSSAALAFTLIMDCFAGTGLFCATAYAKDTSKNITATVYEFDEDGTYAFSSAKASSTAKANGMLTVSGDVYKTTEKNGVTVFAIKPDYDADSNGLKVSYTYNDKLLNAADDEWHLVDDKDKKVDIITLEDKILKGALILQTSKDGKIWVTDYVETDIFETKPNRKDPFYTTTDVQMANGCYYRVIIAYEVSKKVDPSNFLFVSVDEYENKKYVEVYEFYAYDETAQASTVNSNTKKYNLGSKVRTDKFEGYYGSTTITNKDPHYGWDLGQFFVSGYTDSVKDSDGNIVFLKNVGDQMTLWFNLLQDINCLNGNDAITIMEDPAGSDQYFETPSTNFGHGALIIRKNNYENVTETPQIYTNYLEAVATAGANTKVDLFEEGDYEVALDYAINYDKTKVFGKSVLPKQAHYRIYFKFSVRNSNSMFYPRDMKTTSELSNNAITSNGFYLDLANSKYLQLNIIREVLKDGATGLTEDVRFNTSAKDGDRYTDEGIYTITVTNQYTGKSTTKQIYVGENNLLKAYTVTGLSISEIQDKIAMGATIADDGTIIELFPVATEEESQMEDETEIETETVETEYVPVEQNPEDTEVFDVEESDVQSFEVEPVSKSSPVLPIAIGAVVVVACGYLLSLKKKKAKNENKEGE